LAKALYTFIVSKYYIAILFPTLTMEYLAVAIFVCNYLKNSLY